MKDERCRAQDAKRVRPTMDGLVGSEADGEHICPLYSTQETCQKCLVTCWLNSTLGY